MFGSSNSRRRPAFAALALTLCGCAAQPQAVPFADGHKARVTIQEGVAQRTAREITYRVRSEGCDSLATGSAVALDAHTVVTNRHVVEGAIAITLSSWDGKQATVDSVALDDDHDLAVLHTVEPLASWGELGVGREGETVWVIGYPRGGQLHVTRGSIITAVDGDSLSGEDSRTEVGEVWQVSAKVVTGNSGGPLIGADGSVVGVVYGYGAESENGYAIQSSSVKNALDEKLVLVGSACPL